MVAPTADTVCEVVSTSTLSAVESALALPAVSVEVAVRLCVPSCNVERATDQSPLPSAVTEPTLPSRSLVRAIDVLASAVPDTVGVVALVVSSVAEDPVSEPAARSGVDVVDGAVTSTVTLNAVDAELAFPAASVAVAVRLWAPSESADAVMDQSPLPSAVADPTLPSTSLVRETVTLASDVPETVGVVSFVRSSVVESPVSDPAAKSGADGSAGAVVSTVTLSDAEEELTLPTSSVDVAVRLWSPSCSVVAVMDQSPLPSEVVDPRLPSRSLVKDTVTLASDVPVIVGVVSFVRSSAEESPVSEPLATSGVPGTDGAVLSIVYSSPMAYPPPSASALPFSMLVLLSFTSRRNVPSPVTLLTVTV